MTTDKNQTKKKTILHDIILIALLLAVALTVFLVQKAREKTGTYAVVAVDGQEVARYNLKKNGTYKLNDGTNTLVIQDGTASITEAECPNGLCIQQGRISNDGECIVCLPNRVTVVIEGSGSSADFVL